MSALPTMTTITQPGSGLCGEFYLHALALTHLERDQRTSGRRAADIVDVDVDALGAHQTYLVGIEVPLVRAPDRDRATVAEGNCLREITIVADDGASHATGRVALRWQLLADDNWLSCPGI